MVLKIIYTFLLGIFLSIFVGVGISAFYKGPSAPEMPAVLQYCPDVSKNTTQYPEFKKQAETYNKANNNYMKQLQMYNRNVAILAVIAASALVIVSLTLLKTILLISDGILLGGVLTLIYSVIRGFNTEDSMFQFFVVTVGLIISLVLGYVKFIIRKPSN